MKEEKHHYIRTLFFLIILAMILIIIYGFYLGNKGLIIKEYNINNSTIPETFNEFKIAHFADIYYKDKEDINFLKDITKKISSKKVDIVLFSGGLLKKYSLTEEEETMIIEYLSNIKSKYGKYYISNKKDIKNPLYESIMTQSGFINLNNSKDMIYSKKNEKITLVGINDNLIFLDEALKDKTYNIVFFPESDYIDVIKPYNFNLYLSSNSLNGQINIPFIKNYFLDKNSNNYYEPYYKIDNSDFYITSGIGTRNIDIRLFNKPSVNIYKLKKIL